MADLITTDALRLAINVLRDVGESHKMPSGIELDDATAALHLDAAEALAVTLKDLQDLEGTPPHD